MESDNPFESSEAAAKYPAEMKQLRGEPNFNFEGKVVSLDQDLEYELGKVRATTNNLIEFKLINDLGIPLEYDEISTTCGCLGGLPTNVKIEPGKSIPIRVAFKGASVEESFGKSITLIDRRNSVVTRLHLKGQSLYLCQLKKDSFVATKPGRYTFETQVDFPFDNVEELTFRFNSYEVAGWRVIPTGQHSGLLVFDMIMKEGDKVSSSIELHIVSSDNKIVGYVPIKIIRGFKPATRPSKVVLRPNGKELFGRVVVQFAGLTDPGTNEVVQLPCKGTPKQDGINPIEFNVATRLIGGKDLLTLAELTLSDERVVKHPNDYDLSVLFRVGDETLRVPITILNGDE